MYIQTDGLYLLEFTAQLVSLQIDIFRFSVQTLKLECSFQLLYVNITIQ